MIKKKHGVIWFDFDDEMFSRMEYAINERGHFSRAVDTRLAIGDRHELAIISVDGEELRAVALAVSGTRIGFMQRRVRFSHLQEHSVALRELRKGNPLLDQILSSTQHEPLRITEKEWSELLQILAQQQPNLFSSVKHIDEVSSAGDIHLKRTSDETLYEFERDAVGTAIEAIAGQEVRKSVLLSASGKTLDDRAPFLSQLPYAQVREDAAINHDLKVFPGFDVVNNHVVGAVEYVRGGRHITIVNCNRMRAEENLGVDLLYYSHYFKAFCLVQYKSLRNERGSKFVYRPDHDAGLSKEIAVMRRVLSRLDLTQDTTIQGFRLYNNPFYFKLCKAVSVSPLSTRLSQGIYIPLDLWKATCASAKGSLGATAMTWDNCPRKLSCSEFIKLLRNGWIGSGTADHSFLNDIVQASLQGKKMVVCASSAPADDSEEYFRDDLGRFTSPTDPLGTN